MSIVPWNPVLKLNLYFFILAGPINSAHGLTKKMQSHLNALSKLTLRVLYFLKKMVISKSTVDFF